jgi:hypothetical protein
MNLRERYVQRGRSWRRTPGRNQEFSALSALHKFAPPYCDGMKSGRAYRFLLWVIVNYMDSNRQRGHRFLSAQDIARRAQFTHLAPILVIDSLLLAPIGSRAGIHLIYVYHSNDGMRELAPPTRRFPGSTDQRALYDHYRNYHKSRYGPRRNHPKCCRRTRSNFAALPNHSQQVPSDD